MTPTGLFHLEEDETVFAFETTANLSYLIFARAEYINSRRMRPITLTNLARACTSPARGLACTTGFNERWLCFEYNLITFWRLAFWGYQLY